LSENPWPLAYACGSVISELASNQIFKDLDARPAISEEKTELSTGLERRSERDTARPV